MSFIPAPRATPGELARDLRKRLDTFPPAKTSVASTITGRSCSTKTSSSLLSHPDDHPLPQWLAHGRITRTSQNHVRKKKWKPLLPQRRAPPSTGLSGSGRSEVRYASPSFHIPDIRSPKCVAYFLFRSRLCPILSSLATSQTRYKLAKAWLYIKQSQKSTVGKLYDFTHKWPSR